MQICNKQENFLINISFNQFSKIINLFKFKRINILTINNTSRLFNLAATRLVPLKMKSFIQYQQYCDFPIENLPYGVFSTNNDVSKMKKYIV